MSHLIGRKVTAHVEVPTAQSESGTKSEVKEVTVLDKVRKSGVHQKGSAMVAAQWDEYVVMDVKANNNNVNKVYTIKPEDIIHM
jgi:hypothetical protein